MSIHTKKRKKNPLTKTFIKRLYDILQSEKNQDAICWNTEGNGFYWKDDELMKSVLTEHFKHKNKDSFHRQLNYHGFVKKTCPINKDWSFFQHSSPEGKNLFQRLEPELMQTITRKKSVKDTTQKRLNDIEETLSRHQTVLNHVLDFIEQEIKK